MMNKMDWKAWLGLIVIVMIISGFVSGFAARAESEVPTDVENVEDANHPATWSGIYRVAATGSIQFHESEQNSAAVQFGHHTAYA